MRTTITLDDDVFEAAQTLARGSGRQLGKVVSQLARRGLRAQADVSTKNRLPVFRVPADSQVIPGSRAGVLLAQEAT